jgi:hypothetical protein
VFFADEYDKKSRLAANPDLRREYRREFILEAAFSRPNYIFQEGVTL